MLSRDVSLAAAIALCSGSSDNPAQHPSSTGTLHAATVRPLQIRHWTPSRAHGTNATTTTTREHRSSDRHLEKHGARLAAEAARPAKGAGRAAAAADRPTAEATRAAARKHVEAISPRVPGTETGEGGRSEVGSEN